MSKIKYAWLFSALAILLFNIYGYAADPGGDATGNIMFLLGILGFPLSIVPTLLVLVIVGYVIPDASNPYIFSGICISYVAAGLIQWFWLVPAITRRVSQKKQKQVDI